MKTYLLFLTLLISPAFGVLGKSLIQVDDAEPHIKPSKTKFFLYNKSMPNFLFEVYQVSTGETPTFYQEIMELKAKATLRRILVIILIFFGKMIIH